MRSESSTVATYDTLASAYDDGYRGPFWDLHEEITHRVAAERMPRAPSLLLDAGGGTGRHAQRLLDAGHEVILLEPSPGMLAKARERLAGFEERGQLRFLAAPLQRIPLADATVDFVFCEGDPLSYCLTDHDIGARELLRVLRPGGGFYVSVDNRWLAAVLRLWARDVPGALASAERGESADPYALPVHAFDPAELATLFENAGAEEVQVAGKIGILHLLDRPRIEALRADPDAWARIVAIEHRWARSPALAGLSAHLHVTGRKRA